MSQSGDPGVEQARVTEAGGGSHGVSKADLPAPAEHLSAGLVMGQERLDRIEEAARELIDVLENNTGWVTRRPRWVAAVAQLKEALDA